MLEGIIAAAKYIVMVAWTLIVEFAKFIIELF